MNLLQMAESFVVIDSAGRAIQIKHGKEKDAFDLDCLMEIGRFYIPRGEEMGIHKDLSAWDPYMFLTGADYYESEGFREE